jgi:hypothetical protein
MPFPGECGIQGDENKGSNRARPGSRGVFLQFTPMVFDGRAWVRISAPQPTARAACLNVTAYISLLSPSTSLSDLDAAAEAAIGALEEGAWTVTVIDEWHRVDRADLCQARDSRR